MSSRVLGAVLVGGASSRFGSDKAAADWRGEPLAAHAAAKLAPFCHAVVQVGGGGIADRPHAGLGPLGGIAGALHHAAANGFGTVLTIACDMPRVPAELVEALLRRAPACCADAPVLGHWPAALAGEVIEQLDRATARTDDGPRLGRAGPDPAGTPGETGTPDRVRAYGKPHHHDGSLSVRRWAERIGALSIASPVPLANINTPADLLAL